MIDIHATLYLLFHIHKRYIVSDFKQIVLKKCQLSINIGGIYKCKVSPKNEAEDL